MKLAVSISLLFSALPLIAASTLPERRAYCNGRSSTAPFRAFYNTAATSHYYSADIYDTLIFPSTKNFTLQTTDISQSSVPYLHVFPYYADPLLQLYVVVQPSTQTYLYTTDAAYKDTLLSQGWSADSGSRFGGTAGYVFPDGNQCPGTVPLLWASSSSLTDNVYTIVQSEYNALVASGYTANGAIGWVYPGPARMFSASVQTKGDTQDIYSLVLLA